MLWKWLLAAVGGISMAGCDGSNHGFSAPVPSLYRPGEADFNGDGRLDHFQRRDRGYGSTLVIMLSGEDGFVEAQEIPSGRTALADFNGDRAIDIAIAYWAHDGGTTGVAEVWLNDGRGTFASVGISTESGWNVQTADIDGDGFNDVVLPRERSGGSLIAFGPDFTRRLSVDDISGFSDTGDFDGDGHLDLVLYSYEERSHYIRLGDGTGLFRGAIPVVTQVAHFTQSDTSVSKEALDVNSDGYLDLLTTGVSPRPHMEGVPADTYLYLSVVLGDGNARFLPPRTYLIGDTSSIVRPVSGYFDSKGNVAVAAYDRNEGSLLYFEGDGDGLFAPAVRLETCDTEPRDLRLLSLDVDNNGRPDLLLCELHEDACCILFNEY